jgi:hypothetical protein
MNQAKVIEEREDDNNYCENDWYVCLVFCEADT